MISINSYAVTEDYVFRGVGSGVEELLKDVSNFSKPETVVSTITEHVMAQLCQVMDFAQTPVRFTPDILRQIYLASREAEINEPAKS